MIEQPRPIRVVLSAALQEIHERRRRLDAYQTALDREKQVAEAAMDGLKKLIADCPGPLPGRTNGHKAAATDDPPYNGDALKPGELTQREWDVIGASLSPLTKEQISERVGRTGRGLSMVLSRATKNGTLVQIDDGYGLASRVDPGGD